MKKPLPTVSTPTIITTLPLTKKKVSFRPFVNKEKKSLLLAKSDDDFETTLETLRSVVHSCTNGEVDIREIPVSDAAYLFIQMRIQSIGDNIAVATSCKNCEETFHINYRLADVKMSNEDWDPILMLDDNVGIKLKAPSFDDVKFADTGENEKFVASLIVEIFDQNEVYESSLDEVVEWLDGLDDISIKKIKEKIADIPTLYQEIKYTCPKCSHPHEIKLEGLSDFF